MESTKRKITIFSRNSNKQTGPIEIVIISKKISHNIEARSSRKVWGSEVKRFSNWRSEETEWRINKKN